MTSVKGLYFLVSCKRLGEDGLLAAATVQADMLRRSGSFDNAILCDRKGPIAIYFVQIQS